MVSGYKAEGVEGQGSIQLSLGNMDWCHAVIRRS